jgi:hypothetical protein
LKVRKKNVKIPNKSDQFLETRVLKAKSRMYGDDKTLSKCKKKKLNLRGRKPKGFFT